MLKRDKRIKYIFNWLSKVVAKEDIILFEHKNRKNLYHFSFPLKIGDKPQKIRGRIKANKITFLVTLSSKKRRLSKEKWILIFDSPNLYIWESRNREKLTGIKPLRWGLSKDEKLQALKIARKSLEYFLEKGKSPTYKDLEFNGDYSSCFKLVAGLEVSIWFKGSFRGSMIFENKNLLDGIIEASSMSSYDSHFNRFKPIEFEDLSFIRIEITIFSGPKIPLTKEDFKRDEIDYSKGYFFGKRLKAGWFFPKIFNIKKFKNLHIFLQELAAKEDYLDPSAMWDKKPEILFFEVDDFIENENKSEALDLEGPVAEIKEGILNVEEMGKSAAGWLLKNQEPDGNFVPIIGKCIEDKSKIDWSRSALTSWGLIEFGNTIKNQEYIEAGKRNHNYIRRHILENSSISKNNPLVATMAIAFLGQCEILLGNYVGALDCGNKILEIENSIDRFEPITFQQVGSFLAELSKIDRKFLKYSITTSFRLGELFENNLSGKAPMNLSAWSELANLDLKLFEITGSGYYSSMSKKIVEWILNYQKPTGDFWSNESSGLPFTRGTSKIAEVLGGILVIKNDKIDEIFDSSYIKKCVEKSFGWIFQMQYTKENTYFIPEGILLRDHFIGGFRHDYFNCDAWVDSAGHFLLAASRYLKFENDNKS